MTPRTDAHALHDLLTALTQAGTVVIHTRWAEILDAEYNSIEYARRHSEVVGLLNETLGQIALMPDKPRQRFERYAFAWWRGVITPEHAWSNRNVPATSIIAQDALDMLGSAAELIEARLDGSLAAPNSDDLEPLREQCQAWIETLDADASVLPPTLRLNLLQDLQHIVWLIEHADLFGVARVADAGQAVVGSMAVLATRVEPAKRGVWVERAKRFINTLVILSALLQGVETTMAIGDEATDFLGELTAGPAEPDIAPQKPSATE